MPNQSDSGFTLLQLSKMSFENWATLIELETAINPNGDNEETRKLVAERKMQKFLSSINLSQFIKSTPNNFFPLKYSE